MRRRTESGERRTEARARSWAFRWAVIALSIAPVMPLSGQACRLLTDRGVDTVLVGFGLRASVEAGALTPEPRTTLVAALAARYPAAPGTELPAPTAYFGGSVLVARVPMVQWLLTLPSGSDPAALTIALLADGMVHPIETQVRADLEEFTAAGAFAPLVGELKRQFRLELVHGILESDDIPLLIERVEHVVELEVPARTRKPGFPRPPEEAHKRKLDGDVRLRFIITEKGKAEPGSVRAVSQSDSIFIPNAIKSILESEFTPASSGGCPIRQEVEQNVRFRFTG